MAKKKKKAAFLLGLEYYGVLAGSAVIRAIPLKLAYFLAGIVSFFIYNLDKRHRVRAIQHILHAGMAKDIDEAKLLAKKNFVHLGKLFIEIVKMHQIIDKKNIIDYVSLDFPGNTVERMRNEPLIIVTAHCGNWEMAGTAFTRIFDKSLLSIMRPLNNPRIGEFIYGQRARELHGIVSRDEGIKPLISALRKSSSIAIVGDQHAGANEGSETLFFGHPARAHSSPAILHLKTGIPILVLVLARKDDNFHFEFRGMAPIEYAPTGDKKEDVRKLTQLYTSQLEELIRLYPDQWLWSHRRWLNINRG